MEKETIEQYIIESLKELVKRDSDIFKQKIPKLGNSTEKERKLNRDLHETTLNHRFAFYLENILIKNNFLDYNVDIEYNRNFKNKKNVKIRGVKAPIRPDILVHKRMNNNENLLVVEAKKHKVSGHDIDKVNAFMKDENYSYKYGLTISYAYDETKITGTFFYRKSDNRIVTSNIEVSRILL